jgi:hypothetical protein
VSRYNTSPDEVFGRGLAMQCIDDVINLNGFSEDVSIAIDKAVKPTILAKDDGVAVALLVTELRACSFPEPYSLLQLQSCVVYQPLFETR